MLKWLFSRQTGPRTPPAPGKDAPDHIRLGRDGEKVAAALLRRAGFELLDRNWRQGRLELDMVCRESGVLVFVEVKYRRDDKMGNPKEAVDRKKQKKISMTASYYLMRKCGRMDIPCRFDVAAVLGEQIEVVKNAFEYLP